MAAGVTNIPDGLYVLDQDTADLLKLPSGEAVKRMVRKAGLEPFRHGRKYAVSGAMLRQALEHLYHIRVSNTDADSGDSTTGPALRLGRT